MFVKTCYPYLISISSQSQSHLNPIREGEKGAGAVSVGSRLFSRFARVLLACMLAWASLYGAKKHMAKHVARPSSPSIARKSDFCPKKEVKWRDLSVRRGFRLKMETRWHDLPAKLFTRSKRKRCGATSLQQFSYGA